MNRSRLCEAFSALVPGMCGPAIAQAHTAQSTQNAPQVVVGKQLTANANTPAPGTTARNPTQRSRVGKGAASVKASQPSSFWVEDLDHVAVVAA